MSGMTVIEARISRRTAELSGKLQEATNYILPHPIDVASRSLGMCAICSGTILIGSSATR